MDRYELLCPLAYGGMASVWLARFGGRLGFERLVVIKMILPQFSQDPRFQEMFLDEARIASRIEHPNVARILDVGEHEGSYFIVMEWVDGDSLSKMMRAAETKKEQVPAGIALRICADAAAGLHAAHELRGSDGTSLGVVHRDVSPQNILISNAGSTMLIDFGVAKARDRVSQDTSAGQLKGKIRYMAPEQALGVDLDRRADVWAVGAMLYELFGGAPPYDGANEVATLHKLTSGQAPPPLPRTVPEVIRVVVARALAYRPQERFDSALDLNLALEGAMVEIGEPTSASSVAQYTARLLAERKAARRKAVDTAVAASRAREAVSGSSLTSMPGLTGSSGQFAPVAPAAVASSGVMPLPYGESSGSSGQFAASPSNPMSLGESPSATSSATLGSAAMEYLPDAQLYPVRRKRYLGAAFLGVSLAVGVVGLVLIVSSAVIRNSEAARDGAANATANGTAAPAATTEVPDPQPAVAVAPPAVSPPPVPPPSPTPLAVATTTAAPFPAPPAATSTAHATPASTKPAGDDPQPRTAPPTATTASVPPTPKTTPAVTHKPTPPSPAATPPKPRPSGKKDYGF